MQTPPNAVLLTRAGFLCFHVSSLLKLTGQEKAMPHREIHKGVRKILVCSLHNGVLTSASSSLLIYGLLSSPSSPVPCLRAGSDFRSAASPGSCLCVVTQDKRRTPPNPSQESLPQRPHLSCLYADPVLTDAVDTQRLGASFTVVVSGFTPGAVGLG